MYPFLRLGPFLLQLPGLALLGGLWLGSTLSEKAAAHLRLDTVAVYNLIFYGLAAGIVGARLAYAVRYLNTYLADPWSLLALTPATLYPNAGLAIGVAVAALYGQRKKLPLRPTLDALAPALATLLVTLGVAHFLSGDAFGAATGLPWAIYLWDDYRHPSQVYEVLAGLAVLAVAWKRPFAPSGAGLDFALVVALTAAARVFLEAFRGDSVIWPGGFRAAQIIGLLILGAALWQIKRWARPAAPQSVEA